jgi:DNA-binding transcriptional ArsR family regulator
MTKIQWELGSAYDFFISLYVIQHPERFGLRPARAAGVRSRLPAENRQFYEQILRFLPVPLIWVNGLKIPEKNTDAILDMLEKIPAEQRYSLLYQPATMDEKARESIQRLRSGKKADARDLSAIRSIFQRRISALKTTDLQNLAQIFNDPAGFGDLLLQTLRTYQQVFFAEEEERILPSLNAGLEKAREMAANQPIAQLIETLSHGVTLEKADQFEKISMVPSYWTTPLIFHMSPSPDHLLFIFGCRQDQQTLVAGEYIPEALIDGLKALSDPTRLRILHTLHQGATTPSCLARHLRLRPPTVIHHLNLLRLVGLVQVILSPTGEKRYALRQGVVDEIFEQLKRVIGTEK